MAHHPKSKDEWAERHRKALTTRHTHEDVLNDREFELPLEACTALPDPRGFEARFVCLVGGRLGLRAGEIAHFQASWLDWDRKLIRIPQQEPCSCGYCRRQARQEARHNDQLTAATALASRWHPNTVASARSIPFDLSLRIELCIERFANLYDGFPRSRSTVNRRVQEAAEQADLTGRIYPHCLRATAASHHAYKGVAPGFNTRLDSPSSQEIFMIRDKKIGSWVRTIQMDRRTLLQRIAPAALISVAGCNAIKCRIDGNYDRLTMKSLPEPESETSITLGYSNLSSPVQNTVDDAISEGSVKQCHDFSAGMTNIEKFWSRISTEWDKAGETNFEKIERTFLKRDSEYFGIGIIILDVIEVDSAHST